jgi:hypothetical protein
MATIASPVITLKKKPANKPGFWSAILTASLSGAWFIVFTLQQAVAPFPQWRGAEAYLPAFTLIHLLALLFFWKLNLLPWLSEHGAGLV